MSSILVLGMSIVMLFFVVLILRWVLGTDKIYAELKAIRELLEKEAGNRPH